MREREFTPEERQSLESNPNVLKVANSNIIYIEEFKRQALNLHQEGMFTQIACPKWNGQVFCKCYNSYMTIKF